MLRGDTWLCVSLCPRLCVCSQSQCSLCVVRESKTQNIAAIYAVWYLSLSLLCVLVYLAVCLCPLPASLSSFVWSNVVTSAVRRALARGAHLCAVPVVSCLCLLHILLLGCCLDPRCSPLPRYLTSCLLVASLGRSLPSLHSCALSSGPVCPTCTLRFCGGNLPRESTNHFLL